MLNLPKSTELNKQLPKKSIYAKFQMSASDKEKFDKDISRITIVNEVSPNNIHIMPGEKVKMFFVMLVSLKQKEYNEKTIIKLSKLIPQNIVMVLQYEKEARLAVYHSKLLQSDWKKIDELNIDIIGLNFDNIWDNIIVQVGNIVIENNNSLENQIEINSKKEKLHNEINRLEKWARVEKQPKKKFDIVSKIRMLKKEMEKN